MTEEEKQAEAKKPRAFRFLAFVTYLPLPLLGIMVIFGLLGRIMHVGWLESAPSVLLVPMFLAYYISLFMGAIYGYLSKEESVYLLAIISIGVWAVGSLLGLIDVMPREIMIIVNVILLGGLLVLHVLQYRATRQWETRLIGDESR